MWGDDPARKVSPAAKSSDEEEQAEGKDARACQLDSSFCQDPQWASFPEVQPPPTNGCRLARHALSSFGLHKRPCPGNLGSSLSQQMEQVWYSLVIHISRKTGGFYIAL